MTAVGDPGSRKGEARVLVVDDSTFVRKALRRVLEARSGLTVAGEAGDGLEAVKQCAALAPDIVTLDIQMPGMDGLSALREIKRRWPSLPVLVLASASSNGPEVAMEALALGAFEFVDKDRFRSMDFQLMGDEVVKKVRTGLDGVAAHLRLLHPSPRDAAEPGRRASGPSPLRRHAEAICIGASTGGPAALQVILERLPAGFPFPIAIVQHMPVGFTAAFAERLNQSSRLEVREARGGEAFRPGWALPRPRGAAPRLRPGRRRSGARALRRAVGSGARPVGRRPLRLGRRGVRSARDRHRPHRDGERRARGGAGAGRARRHARGRVGVELRGLRDAARDRGGRPRERRLEPGRDRRRALPPRRGAVRGGDRADA